jgi:hypothetical protein
MKLIHGLPVPSGLKTLHLVVSPFLPMMAAQTPSETELLTKKEATGTMSRQ